MYILKNGQLSETSIFKISLFFEAYRNKIPFNLNYFASKVIA